MVARNKNFFIIVIIAIAILALWFFIRFVVGGPEDTWICKDGEWVKHGVPSAPMPIEPCGEKPVACTMEAKLCPDGSSVGRTGPKCEFALCPKEDLIQVESPKANEVIASPLIIKGKARGNWFFEASFPVILTNWDGLIIAQGISTVKSDPANEDGAGWMTSEFVPFEAVLKFEKPASIKGVVNRGSLILKKDNPSGLPKNDDALEIPVFFQSLIGAEIQKLFIEKYPKYTKTVTVNVEKETPGHARGSVIFETGAPGGIFLATKIDGKWQIVFDGNGQIPCNLAEYGFPNEMLSDCVVK